MSVDVVIRESARCLTIVGDNGVPVPTRVLVYGNELTGILADGHRHTYGVMTPAMAELAAMCDKAVVVVMEGPFVASSVAVPFALVKDDDYL